MTKNEEIAIWSSAYELPHRIKAHPSQQALVRCSIPVRASVFEAYIGAVFTESGLGLAETWVKPLIRRVLDLDDAAQRTPRSTLSPLSSKDSEIMDDDELVYRVDALSVAGTTSTRVGSGSGGYGLSWNQLGSRSIAPSSHDGSFTPYTASTGFMEAASAQPMPIATGKPSHLRHEVQLGRYSPNVPGHHSPSQSYPSIAPNSEYSSDTYNHQQSQQSPPYASGNGSFRSNSSNTVRPPARSSRDSPSTNSSVPSPRPSPSITSSSSSSDSSGRSQSSTRSVAGGHLALFNQMATQKKERVEWKITSDGPPHKPTFDAQVLSKSRSLPCAYPDGPPTHTVDNYCHGRGRALTKKQAQQSAAEEALRSLGWA